MCKMVMEALHNSLKIIFGESFQELSLHPVCHRKSETAYCPCQVEGTTPPPGIFKDIGDQDLAANKMMQPLVFRKYFMH